MATRNKKTPNVDLAALQQGDEVDVSNLPVPLDEEEQEMDKSFAVDGSTRSDDGVTASTHEPERITRDPETDDGFVNVFYHPATRKYVQYNRGLEGRSDFRLMRVKKDDFDKLSVRA